VHLKVFHFQKKHLDLLLNILILIKIYSSALPNHIDLRIRSKTKEKESYEKTIDDLNIKLQELQNKLDDIDDDDDDATQNILSQIDQVKNNIKKCKSDIEDIKINLLNLTSDNLREDEYNVICASGEMTFLEEEFSKTNEFLQLRLHMKKKEKEHLHIQYS
jgi:chromosome segregation ATPase